MDEALKIISGGKAKLNRNQKTWKYWGSWANDYHNSDAAYLNGVDPKDYGKSDMAIHIDGFEWEIGCYKRGNGYIMAMDFYGGSGQKLSNMFGRNLEKLSKEYNKQATIRAAQKHGYSWIQEGNKIVINTGSSGNAWGSQQKGWIK